MKIQRMWEESTLEAFAEQHNLTLQMHRRTRHGMAHYTCSFERAELGGDGLLRSVSGDGYTEADAMRVYAQRLSGGHLVLNAYRPDRREIDVPYLTL